MSDPAPEPRPSLGQRRSVTLLADHPALRAVLLASIAIIAVGWALQVLASGAVLVWSVLVPAAIALLFAGLLMPLQVLFNHRLGVPRALAALLAILVAMAAVTVLLWGAGSQLVSGIQGLRNVLTGQLDELRDRVVATLPIGKEEFDEIIVQVQAWLQANRLDIFQGAIGAGFGAANFLISALLCAVATFFFLAQGDRIWAWIVVLMPERVRGAVYQASRRGWVTLGTYCRTQLIIAGVDAVGIGLGAWALGVPFVIPLTAITFVLCFIPFMGAIVSGVLVVVVALAFQGFNTALLMLAIVIAVQQLESNALSPLLLGKAVDIHPLVILLSVTAATFGLGVVGALLILPFVATIKSMVAYVVGQDPFPVLDAGGSALTDSPKELVGDLETVKPPRRMGDATPAWLAREHARRSEAAERIRGGAGAAEEGPVPAEDG